ncbi:MAG TPA: hypothetical protein VIJ28_14340 [Chloroflexota bacterium]|jgi:hypothetical protein
MAHYDAFLLRIWRTGDGATEQWAIRLQHLPDGQVARLADLEDLLAHLQAVLPADPASPNPLGDLDEQGLK